MKAEVIQQRSLLELAEVDAELGRLDHRASHLAEQQRLEQVQADAPRGQRPARGRCGIALDDLDGQIAKFEAEIDAVRQREDRDRDAARRWHRRTPSSSANCSTNWRRWSAARPASRTRCSRSWSAARSCRHEQAERARHDRRPRRANCPRRSGRATTRWSEIDQSRHQRASRRDELTRGLDADLVALYERQRARGGAGRRRVCRAVGAVPAGSRSTAARWRGSRRPPTTRCCAAPSAVRSCCGSRTSASEGASSRPTADRAATRVPPATARWCSRPTARRCWPSARRRSATPPTTSPSTAV